MADTAALVVALSAQLTKFEKDMQKAGIMAEKAASDVEDKFSKINPSIKTSFLGNFFANVVDKAINAAAEAMRKLIDRFSDLQKTAEYAGTSLQWLYGVQAAGAKAGASIEDMNKAVAALAEQLDTMKRGGENSLTKLFDANPQFLKGMNREAMTLTDTMRVVGNIIANLDNQVQKVRVAEALGMPAGAVQALKDGGDAFVKMSQAAAAAAPNIDNAVEATRKLKDTWAAWIKDLGSDWAEKALEGFKKLAAVALAITEWEQSLFHGGPLEAASGRELARWQEINRILNESKKSVTSGLTQVEVTGGKGKAKDPFGLGGGGAKEADEFERANDQITKHIALMNADTKAAGANVYEKERLRAEAALMEGMRRKLNLAEGEAITLTAEQTARIAAQADAAGRAAQALAEATFKVGQINAASQQLGSAISSAFADAIVEGKKLNEVLDSLVKTLLKAAINSSIMSLFTPGAGGGTAPFAKMLGFAGGTNSAPGGMALVGERGPEIVNLPRGSQVIPNNVARNMGAGGDTQYYNFNVAGDVSQSTIDRLQQAVVAAHRKADGLARVVTSTRRLQATGVG
jgi:hypothetical protein